MECLPLDRGAPKEEMSPGASGNGEPANLGPKNLLVCSRSAVFDSRTRISSSRQSMTLFFFGLVLNNEHNARFAVSVASTPACILPDHHKRIVNWFRELILEIELLYDIVIAGE